MSQQNHQSNLRIKRHEDNIIFLQSEIHRLGASILDLQEIGTRATNENGVTPAEEEETEQILQHEKSAASLLCRLKLLKSHHATQTLNLALTKDVLGIVGIVATLGRVNDDKLSRTYEAVEVLEKYDADGTIISNAGIHGLGSSIGKSIKGRFLVICLEDLSPYAGDFVADDPQRKLALQKPQLPNGECPPGFLDYAVNTIKLDSKNLACVTSGGDGLRETLFHTLFSRLQIYSTRAEMLLALPCINDGAVSLDGGIIKKSGSFILGDRKDLQIKFPVTYEESSMPQTYAETDDLIKKLKWERTYVTEDMQREQELLDLAKANLTGTSVIP